MSPFFNLTYSLIYAARDQLRELFSESKFGFESDSTPDSFAETLIELSSCNNDKLVQRSLHLLNRHFSAETTLFQRAVQTQLLITKESKEVRFTDSHTIVRSSTSINLS